MYRKIDKNDLRPICSICNSKIYENIYYTSNGKIYCPDCINSFDKDWQENLDQTYITCSCCKQRITKTPFLGEAAPVKYVRDNKEKFLFFHQNCMEINNTDDYIEEQMTEAYDEMINVDWPRIA